MRRLSRAPSTRQSRRQRATETAEKAFCCERGAVKFAMDRAMTEHCHKGLGAQRKSENEH